MPGKTAKVTKATLELDPSGAAEGPGPLRVQDKRRKRNPPVISETSSEDNFSCSSPRNSPLGRTLSSHKGQRYDEIEDRPALWDGQGSSRFILEDYEEGGESGR